MISIPIGITLLALAGGTFLLAKTTKYELGLLFKILAYFIIIASFLNFVCIGIQCAMQYCHTQHSHHEMKMHEKYMEDGMMFHHGMGGEGYWGQWKKDCPCEDGCKKDWSASCNKYQKEMKDSCVIKKKSMEYKRN